MKRLLLLIACALTLWGCEFNRETEPVLGATRYTHHYISDFTIGDKLRIGIDNSFQDPHILDLFFENSFIGGLKPEIREALYEKYGDTSYDRYVPLDPGLTACYANEFELIEITSSADFGDIKAGESLAEIVMFRSASAKPFIDSKYTVPGVWTEEIKSEIGYYPMSSLNKWQKYSHPIVKRVCDLTPEDMKLLSEDLFSLRFTQTPEIKEHTITISLVDNEKRHTAQIDLVFP